MEIKLVKGLVSIAIPAYKAKYLAAAIRSALNQTYKNIELIIVDDCSPENLNEIVNSFNDDRIRFYKNDYNIGSRNPVYNWNKCLSYVRGEFFCLLCDDDAYDESFVQNILLLKGKYRFVNVFRSRVRIINEDGETSSFYPSSPEYETCLDYMWHKLYNYRLQTISEFVFETKHIIDLGGFVPLPMAWGSDLLSVLNFSLQRGIVTSPYILVNFRMSGSNISSQHRKFVREKMAACYQFKNSIAAIVEKCEDLELKKMLFDANNYNWNYALWVNLSYSSFFDFCWICFYYHPSKKNIIRGVFQNLKNRIRYLRKLKR